jgi:hypothetical protein
MKMEGHGTVQSSRKRAWGGGRGGGGGKDWVFTNGYVLNFLLIKRTTSQGESGWDKIIKGSLKTRVDTIERFFLSKYCYKEILQCDGLTSVSQYWKEKNNVNGNPVFINYFFSTPKAEQVYKIYKVLQKELYNFDRLYKFIQRTCTVFWTVIM